MAENLPRERNQSSNRKVSSMLQEADRVNIAANNNPADISGGYLAEFTHGEAAVPPLPTINGSVTMQQWNIKYPKRTKITTAQVDYLQKSVFPPPPPTHPPTVLPNLTLTCDTTILAYEADRGEQSESPTHPPTHPPTHCPSKCDFDL